MKRLLLRAGVDRGAVRPWSPALAGDTKGRWRRRIINEALRPAAATADWLKQIDRLRAEAADDDVDPIHQGLQGLSVISARTEDETAAVAALLLRETLETPGRTAALITPDAALARRVSARLTRWGVTADSSAGAPLAGYPAAALAGLLARTVADGVDPVELLAVLKHPLTRLGMDAERLAVARRDLERCGLRGPRPRDWAEIERRVAAAARPQAETLLAGLGRALKAAGEPFASGAASSRSAARALAQALEMLATGPDGVEVGGLWAGSGGEALVGVFSALIDDSAGLPDVTPPRFADLLESLLAGEIVRTGGANHPRLRILGAIEARLVRADRLVLAGLEEGVWPAGAPVDPFLSRPMRALVGLPPPERRIGLSAHDFAQAACAPDVVLLHTERRGDAPTVESRWLWRLRTLASGAGVALPSRPELLDWARALDAPIAEPPAALRTAARPRPTPPVELRPTELPVTGVERWVRDPYALYARRILRLRPLERPDEPVEARIRGTAIHKAFERFAEEHPGTLGQVHEDLFASLLIEELAAAGMPDARLARERALARNVAPWVVEFERRRRDGARLLIERSGAHIIQTPRGPFTLTAKADRIEHRADGADILDFKTGLPPSQLQVEAGLSPQLTLTAAILQMGGFADLGPTTPRELVYVRVSGGRRPGQEVVRAAGPQSLALARDALEGLKRRIEAFEDRNTAYVSWAAPQFIGQFDGDYDHLARLWEWHVIGEGEGEGAA
jgi:ATP-dependent helicase/nuclease subunit B